MSSSVTDLTPGQRRQRAGDRRLEPRAEADQSREPRAESREPRAEQTHMSTIIVAGGTGLLGTALVEALRLDGESVIVLTRQPSASARGALVAGRRRRFLDIRSRRRQGRHQPRGRLDRRRALDGSSKGGHPGEPHASHERPRPRDHRGARQPPSVFISSSAVGFYGARGDEPATETTAPGSDFLADVCRDWEALANQAAGLSRVVRVRSGVVLAREGGALPQLALPFKLFAGGPVGNRTAIRVVDSHTRLGGDGEVGARDDDRRGCTQRDRAGPRDERRVCSDAGPRARSTVVDEGTGLCIAPRAWRNGGCARPRWPARTAGRRAASTASSFAIRRWSQHCRDLSLTLRTPNAAEPRTANPESRIPNPGSTRIPDPGSRASRQLAALRRGSRHREWRSSSHPASCRAPERRPSGSRFHTARLRHCSRVSGC